MAPSSIPDKSLMLAGFFCPLITLQTNYSRVYDVFALVLCDHTLNKSLLSHLCPGFFHDLSVLKLTVQL